MTGEPYRADKLLEDHIDALIEATPTMPTVSVHALCATTGCACMHDYRLLVELSSLRANALDLHVHLGVAFFRSWSHTAYAVS